jgi:hypothetical protein
LATLLPITNNSLHSDNIVYSSETLKGHYVNPYDTQFHGPTVLLFTVGGERIEGEVFPTNGHSFFLCLYNLAYYSM